MHIFLCDKLITLQVGDEINQVTTDMRVISDGLGSGVTPEQLQTSVEMGKRWLEQIKQYDFSRERNNAVGKLQVHKMFLEAREITFSRFLKFANGFMAAEKGVNTFPVNY